MLNTAMRNAVTPFQKPSQMRSRKFLFFGSVMNESGCSVLDAVAARDDRPGR
jgi:hypothetical protein